MARVLHYPADDAELHRSFAALRKALDETVHKSEEYARNTLGFANNDPITLISRGGKVTWQFGSAPPNSNPGLDSGQNLV